VESGGLERLIQSKEPAIDFGGSDLRGEGYVGEGVRGENAICTNTTERTATCGTWRAAIRNTRSVGISAVAPLGEAPEGGITVGSKIEQSKLALDASLISGARLPLKKPMALVSLVSDVLKTPRAKSPLGLCLRAREPAHSSKLRAKKVVLVLVVVPSGCGMNTLPLAKPPPPACKRSSRSFS
jgi:hypothetical protein